MNDLDLHTALQRDADLVGEPAPDLLEQLHRRRGHQRRQRLGIGAAVLGVVVIGGGISLGASLTTDSDSRTATDPTPSVSIPAAPSTSAAPSTTAPTPPPAAPSSSVPPAGTPGPASAPTQPATSTPSAAATSAATSAPASASGSAATVSCPGVATLRAALPADTADHWFTMDPAYASIVCSGSWAAAGYSEHESFPDDGDPETPTVYDNGQAGLFRYVGGTWTMLDRTAHCGDTGIPAAVWERGCNVD